MSGAAGAQDELAHSDSSTPAKGKMSTFGQKIWSIEAPNLRRAGRISKALNLDPLTATLLVNRGIEDEEDAWRFLNPSLQQLHDPFLISHMEEAVLRVRRALARNEGILVFGDDDVDGLTSTTVIFEFLRTLGGDVRAFIPQRAKHGHGITQKALDVALEGHQTHLMITADCGLSALAEIAYVASKGIDTIIVDHHEMPELLPEAVILNPRTRGSRFPFRELAAVGVAFKFICALRSHFAMLGVFANGSGPLVEESLDLVSLGTVADVVPLIDENRVFVSLGLEVLRRRRRCGVSALLEKVTSEEERITERTICYRLAPRLNAAGRMGDANRCVSMLSTDRYAVAQSFAHDLEGYNEKRQATEGEVLREAIEIAEEQVADGRKVLVVYKEGWHQGVLGIVASRLLERFHRPTLLIAVRDGRARGSARSPSEFGVLNLLHGCEDLIENYGGHAAAAGLTMDSVNLPELSRRIEAQALEVLKSGLISEPMLRIDAEVGFDELSLAQVKKFEKLGPFGAGNMEPTFLLHGARTLSSRVVGRNHLRAKVRIDRSVLDVIGFSMGDTVLTRGVLVDLVLTPRITSTHHDQIELQLLAVQEKE